MKVNLMKSEKEFKINEIDIRLINDEQFSLYYDDKVIGESMYYYDSINISTLKNNMKFVIEKVLTNFIENEIINLNEMSIVMVQDVESDGETTFYEYLLKYKDWLFKIDNEWLNN